jgi:hypothetical protein
MSKKVTVTLVAGLLSLLLVWAVPSFGSLLTGPFWHFRYSFGIADVIAHGTAEMTAFFSTERTEGEALEYLQSHGMRCGVWTRLNSSEVYWRDPSLASILNCGHWYGLLFGQGNRWYAIARTDHSQSVVSFETRSVCMMCP